MSAVRKRKESLELQPIQGRMDILAYRLGESTVRMVERKIGIAGLWDAIKDDVESMIVENIGPQSMSNDVGYQIMKRLMELQRVKGGI